MPLITVNLEVSSVNTPALLPTSVSLRIIFWALIKEPMTTFWEVGWAPRNSPIVAYRIPRLRFIETRPSNENFYCLYYLSCSPQNTEMQFKKSLLKLNRVRNVWTNHIQYSTPPASYMLIILKNKKPSSINFFTLIIVFFPSWPPVFNLKFSRRWLEIDGDERSCLKQLLSVTPKANKWFVKTCC